VFEEEPRSTIEPLPLDELLELLLPEPDEPLDLCTVVFFELCIQQ
jgi:hypothetical protein